MIVRVGQFSRDVIGCKTRVSSSTVIGQFRFVYCYRAVGRGVRWVSPHPLTRHKGPLNLRERVKMTLRILKNRKADRTVGLIYIFSNISSGTA